MLVCDRLFCVFFQLLLTFYYLHPPFNLSHCLSTLTCNVSTSMQIWNVNDHPEGQTEKVTHFHAMLNMQILWQTRLRCR